MHARWYGAHPLQPCGSANGRPAGRTLRVASTRINMDRADQEHRVPRVREQNCDLAGAWRTRLGRTSCHRIDLRPRLLRRSLQARLQSLSISRMPENAQMRESPSASSTFGSTVTSRSTRDTIRSLTSEMARQYRVLRALPWYSGIRKVAHRRSPFIQCPVT